jgi:hypothetical protein
MKALKLIFIGIILFFASTMQAQFSFNVNIGTPPPWGPAGFASVRYYYLPDVEAYYDVQTSMFIYYGGGVWLHRVSLPARYKNYDLYGGYKVVMKDYHGNTPYTHFRDHKAKYGKGYHGNMQRTVGERPGGSNHYNHGNYNGHGYYKDNNHGNDKKGHGDGNGKNGHGDSKGKKK